MQYRAVMIDVFRRETDIANALSRSIEERAFAIHVQPQVTIEDGGIVAAEALTRFTDPELRRYPVQEIFDVAEERGLGSRLSEVLLELAADTALELHSRPETRVPVAINLSPSTLKAPRMLVKQLRGWVDRGLDPSMITLEITEDAISGRGLDQIHDTMDTIDGMGFALALDDFGTGHASLAHVHSLPISELKIAKQFVDAVTSSRTDQAIVRSALVMCDHLGIRCVVEGVETPLQAAALVSMGAREAQGYRWARPMPVGAFTALMAQGGVAPGRRR